MKKAALSTRNRKDGAFVGDEGEGDDRTTSGESEREKAQPAAPGDLLWLQEDTDTSSTQEKTAAGFVLPADLTKSKKQYLLEINRVGQQQCFIIK